MVQMTTWVPHPTMVTPALPSLATMAQSAATLAIVAGSDVMLVKRWGEAVWGPALKPVWFATT